MDLTFIIFIKKIATLKNRFNNISRKTYNIMLLYLGKRTYLLAFLNIIFRFITENAK